MKAGFVAIIGRPNVGKSTLMNALVGSKISIVTHKAQTTRDAIQGIVTRGEGQAVFIDSPGVHEPSMTLGRRMMREVRRAARSCHLLLLVVDSKTSPRRGDRAAAEIAAQLNIPAVLVLNKLDLLPAKEALLPRIEEYAALGEFAEIVPISAVKRDGIDLLLDLVFARLPEAPAYYPDDYITDQPERFLAAELIRERVILTTHQEVPYSAAVVVERWEQSERLLRVAATIYVERAGQKGIIIGEGGNKLKEIGTSARLQLESWFGCKVFLELFVKVHRKWRDQGRFVDSLDFHRLLGA